MISFWSHKSHHEVKSQKQINKLVGGHPITCIHPSPTMLPTAVVCQLARAGPTLSCLRRFSVGSAGNLLRRHNQMMYSSSSLAIGIRQPIRNKYERPIHRTNFSYAGPRKLSDILKTELLDDKSSAEIVSLFGASSSVHIMPWWLLFVEVTIILFSTTRFVHIILLSASTNLLFACFVHTQSDLWMTYHEGKEKVHGLTLDEAKGKSVLSRAAQW